MHRKQACLCILFVAWDPPLKVPVDRKTTPQGGIPCPSRYLSGWFSVGLAKPHVATPGGFSRSSCSSGLSTLHRLRDVGGVPGQPLHVRPVPLAVLFAGAVRRLAAQLVRAEAGWWPAWLPFSPALLILPIPGSVPLHLLLLPRRLLQGVLGRSAVLRRRRAAQELPAASTRFRSSCRTSTATSSTSRCSSSFVLVVRRVEGALVHRPGDGHASFGIGVGTLVLAANVVLLGGYTFGCHSLRHLVGGCLDQLSRASGAQARPTTA